MQTAISENLLISQNKEAPYQHTRINDFAVYEMEWLLKVINQKQRKRIINCLELNHKMSFSEINEMLQLNKSFLLQHLRILRLAKIIVIEENVKGKYYSLNHSHVSEVAGLLNKAALLNKVLSVHPSDN